MAPSAKVQGNRILSSGGEHVKEVFVVPAGGSAIGKPQESPQSIELVAAKILGLLPPLRPNA